MRAVKERIAEACKTKHRLIILALIAVVLSSATGCTPTARSVGYEQTPELAVAAAASLQTALPAITKAFTKKTNIKVRTSFASSGLLARQIENGGPFDIYLSANKRYMDELINKKLVKSTRPYAEGELVLVGKAETLNDLRAATIERIAIANPAHAPYGTAAKEALVKSGLWPALKDKIIFGSNIAQAYDYVKTNNVDAGIVSLSMLKDSKTHYLLINQHLYRPIQQWAGVTAKSDSQQAAEKFLEYLSKPESRKILKSFGYKIPRGAK